MINLTNNLNDITAAIKYKAEHLTETINEAINNNAGDNIVDLLKEEQDKLNDLYDKLENLQDEGYTNLGLLQDEEADMFNEGGA